MHCQRCVLLLLAILAMVLLGFGQGTDRFLEEALGAELMLRSCRAGGLHSMSRWMLLHLPISSSARFGHEERALCTNSMRSCSASGWCNARATSLAAGQRTRPGLQLSPISN
jgi:hypothetical protein